MVQEDGSLLGTCNQDWSKEDSSQDTVLFSRYRSSLAKAAHSVSSLPLLLNSPGSGRGGHSTSQDGSGEREGGGRGDLSLSLVSPWTRTSAASKEALLDGSAFSTFENAKASRLSLSPNASEASMTAGQLSVPTHQPANFVSPQAASYSRVPGDRNWHIETADCNLAGFFTIFRSPGMGEGGDWWS